jgi:UDP-N-acetylmuramate: L-alanyl-gamma-D-glutamyl-meso-diaminopimelate ligase
MNIYFLGIAGAGMSALASVLVSQGHCVCGSDEDVFPPVSTYLERMGIAFHVGFDAAKIPPALDVAIIGASAKLELAHNPEFSELTRRGVPTYSFAAYLGRLTARRRNLVIAGSFGKSTVTALCAVLMREAGRDPGYFIGAVPLDLDTTGHWGADAAFLIEGDEYVVSPADRRSKFLLYHPEALLLTSLVHDHVNVFPSMADYERPFAQLIDDLPQRALVVCAQGFEPLRRLTAGRRPVWYGLEPCEGYFASSVRIGEVTRFDLVTPGGRRIPLETELLGLHNIENIVGAAALLLERGDVDADSVRRGVRRFRGVARRLDKKTRTSTVPAYEGFGSSYEKARSAIEAIALHFPDRPAIVIFEPHTFSWRSAGALGWYDTVFAGVARVLLLAPPQHGASSHDQVGQDEILARIRRAGVAAEAMQRGSEVLANLAASLTGNEVVLLLSSGPLDGLAGSLPDMLEARFGAERSLVPLAPLQRKGAS